MSKHPVLVYMAKRIALYVFTIWGAFTIAFIFFHTVPGDPIGAYVRSMEQRYGRKIQDSEQIIQEWRKSMGLDGPLWYQYLQYLKNVFLRFDLGPSFINFPTPARKYIFEALPWTVEAARTGDAHLMAAGIHHRGPIRLEAGVPAGQRTDGPLPGLLANPTLFHGLGFADPLRLHAWAGYPAAAHLTPQSLGRFNWEFIKSVIRYGTLPALSLILVTMFGWVISTRAMVVSILGEDYLIYAKAKGLKAGDILRNYVLRNAMLPQVTGLAISLGFILNGAILVETIFQYPGMGYVLTNSISSLDYNTVQGIMLMSIALVMTATLLLDLLMPLLDPRVARQGNA